MAQPLGRCVKCNGTGTVPVPIRFLSVWNALRNKELPLLTLANKIGRSPTAVAYQLRILVLMGRVGTRRAYVEVGGKRNKQCTVYFRRFEGL